MKQTLQIGVDIMTATKKNEKVVAVNIEQHQEATRKQSNRYDGRANLKPVRSKEEAREKGRLGGIKSGESRRAFKTFQQILMETLTDEKRTEILEAMQKRALKGDTKAFELLRDTLGEKPIDKTTNLNVDVSYEDYIKKASDDNAY